MNRRRHFHLDRRGAGCVERVRTRRAFTLVEVLVAAAITAVLAGLMLTLFGNVLRSWNRSHGTLTAEGQARVVLDQLTGDLQGALYRHDGNAWLAATVRDSLAGAGKPAGLTLTASDWDDLHFGAGGVWLRFFTPKVGGSPAAPEAVGYVLGFGASTSVSGAESHYQLFRLAATPATTLQNGYAIDGAPYATQLATTDPAFVIADNVIDFGVKLYVRDRTTGALTLIFPADPDGRPADTTAPYLARSPSSDATATDRFPEVADVMVRILTEDGAQQIRLLEAGTTTGDWWTIAQAHSRVFTRRVSLHPSPL